VTDSQGTIVLEAAPRQRQAISPTTAYLMSSMLAEVVSHGTGYGARTAGFRLPAAGKTGTSDDFMDAWFIGYTPHLVAGVWFGFDDPAMIMREGFAGTVAVPAWGQFMRTATAGARPDWYVMPSDVEKVAVCRLSGARATDACRYSTVIADRAAHGMQDASLTSVLPGSPTAGLPGELQPIRPLPTTESTVYEDLFPTGAMPIETCWMHGAASPSDPDGQPSAPTRIDTPLVDESLKQHGTRPVGTSGVPAPATSVIESAKGMKIMIQRVVGADGVTRTVMKQIR
jgi:hypothetical protein